MARRNPFKHSPLADRCCGEVYHLPQPANHPILSSAAYQRQLKASLGLAGMYCRPGASSGHRLDVGTVFIPFRHIECFDELL